MKKYLKNVTLLAYDTRPEKINDTAWALQKCCEGLDFFEVKLLTDIEPSNLPENIKWEYAPHINHIDDFNLYMFKYLWKHFDTSHCLYVQDHAWVLHPELWDDSWLQYDYCASPWPLVENSYAAWGSKEIVRVGNGGFSIRSHKLSRIPYEHDLPLLQEQSFFNEDGNLTCYFREAMLAWGIKYAPVEVAARFAYENTVPENEGLLTFGYHRNLPPW